MVTKEEASHMSEVLKAYSEGKTVQYYNNLAEEWYDVGDNPAFCLPVSDYRIKPEPKLRPYKDPKEFIEAQKAHGTYITESGRTFFRPLAVYPHQVKLDNYVLPSFEDLMGKYKWFDGSPCGIYEEE